MLKKLDVEIGSHELVQLIEDGVGVYRSEAGEYFLDCTPDEVTIHKLTKVEKPKSLMGRWAYKLALKSKGE